MFRCHANQAGFKLRHILGHVAAISSLVCAGANALAQTSSMGLTGLVHMPDGHMEEDGMFTTGFMYARPYSAPYISLQALPFLQVSGIYTRFYGKSALSDNYGDNKDKSAAFKFRLLPENAWGYWLPELSAGIHDVQGNKLFRSEFIAASKKIDFGYGDADFTLGYGRKRIDGLYGGARFGLHALPSWKAVVEYDKNRYSSDPYANQTGIQDRKTGSWVGALEYSWGPLRLQAGRQHNQNIYNVSLQLPLQQREFIPKQDEVGPFKGGAWAHDSARPSLHQWQSDPVWRSSLIHTLHSEGLRNVRLAWRDGTLAVSVSSERYRYASRGVGRTARIIMAYAPLETEKVEITWQTMGMDGMTWVFDDATVLQRYFAGTATRTQLAQAVSIEYADPKGRSAAAQANDIDESVQELLAQQDNSSVSRTLLSLGTQTTGQSSLSLAPTFSMYLNDEAGAFKYDIGLALGGTANLGRNWWLNGAIRGSVLENISDVTKPSNSELQHVRSDAAEYRNAARVKLDSLYLNKFWQPAKRTYVRASAGLYEEMFGGVGVQALYLHSGGRLAWDASVDGVRQRNYKGTGFHDYKTVTAIASMHYKLPIFEDLTATVRVGRFLARDTGVRYELSRTFKSGVQFGAWYTHTNANDITSPGRPGNPYMDKGVFMRIPLASMMTRDTQTMVGFRLSPWNRDGGQMVSSPGDLYNMMRTRWLDNALEDDGLRSFGDVPTEDQP